jgi:nucleoside-diphosphate-sugar epimerase
VAEAAEAHLLLAERLSEDPSLHGQAFNLSYGEAIDVIDIVRRIIEICGADLEPVIGNAAHAENRRLAMSTEKAKRVWTPQAGFQERLEQTVKWYMAYLTRAIPHDGASAGNGVAMHSD